MRAPRDRVGGPPEQRHRPERDDQGHYPEPGNQQAVDRTAQRTHRNTPRGGQPDVQTDVLPKYARQHRDRRHDAAHRKIDSAGLDHEGHAKGDQPIGCGQARDLEEVRSAEEIIAD